MKKNLLLTMLLAFVGFLGYSAVGDVNDSYGTCIAQPDGDGFDLEEWNPHFDFYYNGFKAGGVLTIVGDNRGDAQVKIVVGDKWEDYDAVNQGNYNISGETYSITLNSGQANTLNSGQIHMQGKNFTIKSVYYKAPEDGGGEDVDSREVVLFDGLDLWMDWSDDAYKYVVYFNHQFKAGETIVLKVIESYGGTWKIGVNLNGNTWTELKEEGVGNNDKNTIYVEYTIPNDEIANSISQYGLHIQGNNYKVGGIIVKTSQNDVKTGGTIKNEAGDTKVDDTPLDEERKFSLLEGDRFRDISYVVTPWQGDVDVQKNSDGSYKVTTKGENQGAGVMALLLEDLSESGQPLDDDGYNGDGAKYGPNGNQEETEVYGEDDPFLQLNKWESLYVTLGTPAVEGTRVSVYYRDLHYSNYIDKVNDESSESYYFGTGDTKIKVDLTPYRYIRAIAVRLPEAGELTVKEMYLYEREDWTKDGQHEIWLPTDNTQEGNGSTIYEGVALGTKRFYGANDDEWRWNPDEGETGAWTNAIEIPAKSFENVKEMNDYHCFAIVYKNAATVDGTGEGADKDTPGQFQLYINFPFYQTDKGDVYKDWIGKYWFCQYSDYEKREDGVTDEEWSKHHLMFDYANADQKTSANPIYTPNIRNQHCFRTLAANTQGSGGSYYVEIPEDKHGQYTHGLVYIHDNQLVYYPELLKAGNNPDKFPGLNDPAEIAAVAEEGPQLSSSSDLIEKSGTALQLIQEHGLAIRGQNVNIMKVVYVGNLDDNFVDDSVIADPTGIFDIEVEEAAPAFVNVYNLQGMAVRVNVPFESALYGLHPGVYIINGRKVLVK